MAARLGRTTAATEQEPGGFRMPHCDVHGWENGSAGGITECNSPCGALPP
ncbi:hypothetical protein BX260_0593 [Streptomyces sp. 5112.2]|nr:hypothetical protein BX260_0593 [Streptomyces sp. 5112.2]